MVCDLLRVPHISVSNAWVFTPNARVFQTKPDVSGFLTVFYGTAATAAQEPSLTATPYLSIGNISPPLDSGSRFCVTGQDCSRYMYVSRPIRGLFTLVPGAGSYSIVVEGTLGGLIAPTPGAGPFPVSSNGSFFSVASFVVPTRTPTPTRSLTHSPTPTRSPTSTPSVAFTESALLISGPILDSFSLHHSHRYSGSHEFPASDVWSPSAHLGQSQGAGGTAGFGQSQVVEATAGFGQSQVVEATAGFGQSQGAGGTAGFEGTPSFNSSANLDESQLAERATLATGALVGIVIAAVAVAGLVVGFVAFRHFCFGSNAADGGAMVPHASGESATSVNANAKCDLSDELVDEEFD
jgi:hypothetical protein